MMSMRLCLQRVRAEARLCQCGFCWMHCGVASIRACLRDQHLRQHPSAALRAGSLRLQAVFLPLYSGCLGAVDSGCLGAVDSGCLGAVDSCLGAVDSCLGAVDSLDAVDSCLDAAKGFPYLGSFASVAHLCVSGRSGRCRRAHVSGQQHRVP